MATLWRCNECDHRMDDGAVLKITVPHPKGGAPVPVGQCPECGAVDQFTNVCDEPGCRKDADCGWPDDKAYRRTCGDHYITPATRRALAKSS